MRETQAVDVHPAVAEVAFKGQIIPTALGGSRRLDASTGGGSRRLRDLQTAQRLLDLICLCGFPALFDRFRFCMNSRLSPRVYRGHRQVEHVRVQKSLYGAAECRGNFPFALSYNDSLAEAVVVNLLTNQVHASHHPCISIFSPIVWRNALRS